MLSMNPDEKLGALFVQLVFQLSSLATMLLGKHPHPESGEITKDLDGARMIIDQLEMLEVKTKGNLGKEEEAILRQTLMSVRMAYVEATQTPASSESTQEAAEDAAPTAADSKTEDSKTEEPKAAEDEASKARFKKTY